MGNPVVHFELNGPDPEGAAAFYAELFGWQTQPFPGDYVVVDTAAGGGINGGLGKSEDGAYATFYVEADDLQPLLDKAESLGGKTVVPVTEQPMVTFARFADPAGNTIGIVKSGEGPGVSDGDNPAVDWFEVMGPDARALWDFYSQLFGWEVNDVSTDAFTYAELHTESEKGIQGGSGSSPDGQPRVTLYATVDDLQKYVERSEALGGTTLLPPSEVTPNLSVAMLMDPQGTMFGLYRRGE